MPARKPLPFADLLNLLFEVIKHTDGKPYRMQDLAQAADISQASVSLMCSGKNPNPRFDTVYRICRFFAVPLSYFEAGSREEALDIIATSRIPKSPEADLIALRATHLSPEAQRDVLRMMEYARRAEQWYEAGIDELPPFPPSDKKR